MPKSAHSVEINHSDVPIRLFQSDRLEFFTHISPIVVVILWLPVAVFFLVRGVIYLPVNASPLVILAGVLLGLFIWSLAEYTLHRFLFHYEPRTAAQEKVFFLFHGVHHAQPQLKSRLVMPPVLSIPMSAAFYGLFYVGVGRLGGLPHWVAPLFAGFILGYLIYDLTHYATHHFAMRSGYLKYLKRYHMMHHFKTPNARFGVSSPVWDKVFRTLPAA